MPQCKAIRIKHRKLCVSDLDRRISLQDRTMGTPTTTVDFRQTFANGKVVWAALKTAKGREMFFTTNMDVAVSHIFYIRWYADLTSDKWIIWGSENYDILDTENIDERDEWYALYCNVRGASSSEVNVA